MATDSMILTAANEVAAAAVAVKLADDAHRAAGDLTLVTAGKAQEARTRLKRAEGRLMELAAQKPAEVTPRAPETPASNGKLELLPNNVAVIVAIDAVPPAIPAPVPSLPAVSTPVPVLGRRGRDRV